MKGFFKRAMLIIACGILVMVATFTLMIALAYNTSGVGVISAVIAALSFTGSVVCFSFATDDNNINV